VLEPFRICSLSGQGETIRIRLSLALGFTILVV
jgi:hypothetical protein